MDDVGANPTCLHALGIRAARIPYHTDVADKQGSRLQNGPMQERYLPSVPIFSGT